MYKDVITWEGQGVDMNLFTDNNGSLTLSTYATIELAALYNRVEDEYASCRMRYTGQGMLLASGHRHIMAAARGALITMVFGKVKKIVLDHTHRKSSSNMDLSEVMVSWRIVFRARWSLMLEKEKSRKRIEILLQICCM